MSVSRALIFLAIVLGITGLIHYYFWVNLARNTQLPHPWKAVVTWAIILLALSIPASFFLSRLIPVRWARPVMVVPYGWMGFMLIFLCLFAAIDIVLVAYRLVGWITGLQPFDPSRRLLLARMKAGGVALFALGQGAAAFAIARIRPRVKELRIRLSRFPRELDGYTIIQVTDMHIGSSLEGDWVQTVSDIVMELKGDLIAVTGDLVDGSTQRLRSQVAPFSKLSAPDGVYFVTGNHEYYSGVTQWIPEIEALGMRVLRNERVTISRNGASFDLAGTDDYSSRGLAPGHGEDIPKAMSGRDPEREVVLLAHQPRSIREASKFDVGLQLSGHTHGGQIWPWHYFVYLQQPYVSGLHKHGSTRTQVYVSDGTGFWGPPMRLGTRNEITVIRLYAG